MTTLAQRASAFKRSRRRDVFASKVKLLMHFDLFRLHPPLTVLADQDIAVERFGGKVVAVRIAPPKP